MTIKLCGKWEKLKYGNLGGGRRKIHFLFHIHVVSIKTTEIENCIRTQLNFGRISALKNESKNKFEVTFNRDVFIWLFVHFHIEL